MLHIQTNRKNMAFEKWPMKRFGLGLQLISYKVTPKTPINHLQKLLEAEQAGINSHTSWNLVEKTEHRLLGHRFIIKKQIPLITFYLGVVWWLRNRNAAAGNYWFKIKPYSPSQGPNWKKIVAEELKKHTARQT